ncbi:MAG TPA: twin-arginine translocase subunit TatC [Calditrichia bacterium]|nr:twin-arginine translocase subunit TatC [Calditrichia bacterium]
MKKLPTHQEMPFLDHLEELRWRIIRILVGVVVGVIVSFSVSSYILDILTLPAMRLDPPLNFQFLKVQAMFVVYLEIGLFGGLVLALPYMLYEIWGFISPALLPKEQRYIIPLLFFSTFLFSVGLMFSYWIILPLALEFFVGLAPAQIRADIAIDLYIGFAIRLLLLFGIIFQLPILSYFLAKIGLLTTHFMRTYRRHSVVVIFIAAALLTPPDPITQIFMGIPLVLLYELSVFIVGGVEKKARKRAEEFEAEYQKEEQAADPAVSGEDEPEQL